MIPVSLLGWGKLIVCGNALPGAARQRAGWGVSKHLFGKRKESLSAFDLSFSLRKRHGISLPVITGLP